MRVYQEGDGPVSLGLGDGLMAASATDQSPRIITFGTGAPCSMNGQTFTIEAVEFEIAVKPRSIEQIWREVPRKDERGSGLNWDGLTSGGINGTPTEPLDSRQRLGGALSPDIAGRKVSHKCSGGEDAAWSEILAVVTTDAGGAWLKSTTVTFKGEGRAYKVQSDWDFIVCGTKTTASPDCE